MTQESNVASQRIADRLRAMILSGELAPGERIRQEELADEFGASRIPVREALRILVTDGLVTMVANQGAWVSSLTMDECTEQYLIRERIEPLLLRQSMPALNATTHAQLAQLLDTMENVSTVTEFIALDRQFHTLTYSGCPTGTLSEIIEQLWNTTQHYRRVYSELVRGTGSGLEMTHLEHRLLLDAITRNDGDDAERILAGHIRRTRLELAKHPEVFAT